MPTVKSIFSDLSVEVENAEGLRVFDNIIAATPTGRIEHLVLTGFRFENISEIVGNIVNCRFVDCQFINCDFRMIDFHQIVLENCKMKGDIKWWANNDEIEYDGKEKEILKNMPTNKEIQAKFGCKCYSLPNKAYVKVEWVCDFCHKHFFEIYRRDKVANKLHEVPNCSKKVCDKCYSDYRLNEKFIGHRTYGYRGEVHKYKTAMDKTNTAILGLEMEFEGDFYGWKELEDAHQGQLHYGYDSSVIGQNELSWDCGSYSWWKYLSTLKPVCQTLGKFGGHAGDSAGIHIHVSRSDVVVKNITTAINNFGKTVAGAALFKAVSLRSDMERFNMYSNLYASANEHHAAISYNSFGTCEFRIFNSTLDYQTILKHLKFCKEVFNAFADAKTVWSSFSPETVAHIKNCASLQESKGFITSEEFKTIIKKLSK